MDTVAYASLSCSGNARSLVLLNRPIVNMKASLSFRNSQRYCQSKSTARRSSSIRKFSTASHSYRCSSYVSCSAAELLEEADAVDGAGVNNNIVLGIDFGGTGIKGAPVDITTGQLLKERIRIPTPVPATPEAVAEVVKQITKEFEWKGAIGVGMPSVVRRGLVRSAANIDKSWIDINARSLYEEATGCQVAVLNDADAAGYAEMAFGAGQDHLQAGVVLMTTFGTGIGTAMFVDGNLVPNLELGHIEVEGEVAEKMASDRVREKEELSWKKWATRVNLVLARYEQYLQPDMIILGGGVSKKDDKFLHLLSVPGGTPIVAAGMRNEAGIVGAALGGAQTLHLRDVLHADGLSKNKPCSDGLLSPRPAATSAATSAAAAMGTKSGKVPASDGSAIGQAKVADSETESESGEESEEDTPTGTNGSSKGMFSAGTPHPWAL